jgi:hypothetical protein
VDDDRKPANRTQRLTAVRKGCGQSHKGPSGVPAQS